MADPPKMSRGSFDANLMRVIIELTSNSQSLAHAVGLIAIHSNLPVTTRAMVEERLKEHETTQVRILAEVKFLIENIG